MIKRFLLYRSFRKEVDRKQIRQEAVISAKRYFFEKNIPSWTSHYQEEFPRYVHAYVDSYTTNYAKNKLKNR